MRPLAASKVTGVSAVDLRRSSKDSVTGSGADAAGAGAAANRVERTTWPPVNRLVRRRKSPWRFSPDVSGSSPEKMICESFFLFGMMC